MSELEQTTLFGAPPTQRGEPFRKRMVQPTAAQKPAPKPGWRPAQTLEERRREARAVEREHRQEPA